MIRSSAAENAILPAWYDVAFSVVPLVIAALTVMAIVSLVRRWRALSVVEAALWTAFVVVLPVVGSLVWLGPGRAATDRRWAESPVSRVVDDIR